MKRVCLTLFWILTATLICSAQTTFYFPHVADGVLDANSVWKTTIFLTNPSSSVAASGTMTFTKDLSSNLSAAGSAFTTISFTDQDGAPAGAGGVVTFNIAPGQSRKYVSSGTSAYAGGFGTVVTTAGTVNGTAIFSNFNGAGVLKAEAGVPAAAAVPRQAIFVDTVGGFNIGVAYANPATAAATVQLELFNSAAVSVAATTQTLGPGNHNAAFTFQMFPGSGQFAGTMQLRSTVPLAAIALRFDPSFSVFTTLPPVTLASIIRDPLTSIARLMTALRRFA